MAAGVSAGREGRLTARRRCHPRRTLSARRHRNPPQAAPLPCMSYAAAYPNPATASLPSCESPPPWRRQAVVPTVPSSQPRRKFEKMMQKGSRSTVVCWSVLETGACGSHHTPERRVKIRARHRSERGLPSPCDGNAAPRGRPRGVPPCPVVQRASLPCPPPLLDPCASCGSVRHRQRSG